MRRRHIFNVVVVIFVMFIATQASSQVIDQVTAQLQVIPGVGHNYIGIGGEIINPADGSVSFRLPIATAPGRQLSPTFEINLDSAGIFYTLAPNPTGTPDQQRHFSWTTSYLEKNAMPFSLNGWSYGLPFYQAQAYVSQAQRTSCGDPAQCSNTAYNYCFRANEFTFRGFGGTLMPINFQNDWPYGGNPQQQNVCTQTAFPTSAAGTNGVGETFTQPPGTNDQPAITATVRSGLSYQFPPIGVEPNPTETTVYPFGMLAQTITDSNGNQIRLQGENGYVGEGNPSLAPGSYLDTVGRTALSWSGLGNPNGDHISVGGVSGQISVKWTPTMVTLPQTVSTPNGGAACILGSKTMPISSISEIDLPNSTKYLFSYGGAWGLLNKITFPDGGYVRYVWGINAASIDLTESGYCQSLGDSAAITDRYVSFDGINEVQHQVFSAYTTAWTSYSQFQSWTSKHTSVTDYELTGSNWTKAATTTYNYVPLHETVAVPVPLESSVVVQDASGNTIQTTNNNWYDPYLKLGEQIILEDGQGRTTLNCIDGIRVTATYEYDFQSAGAKPADPPCPFLDKDHSLSAGLNLSAIGPLLRQKKTTYTAGTSNLDLPSSIIIFDDAGTKLKETDYYYDGTAVVASGTQVGLVPVSSPATRGNLTSVSQWLNTSSAPLTTTYTYFDTGQVQSITEPCGTMACPDLPSAPTPPTTYSYQDNWATGSLTSQTNAYPTKVTDSLSHYKAFSYNYASGELAAATDYNKQTTTYSYSDPLLRVKDIYGPSSSQAGNAEPHTHYEYVDGSGANVAVTDPIGVVSTSFRDGMGHQTQSQRSDPPGTDNVDTVYDGLGRVLSISNPYRGTAAHGVTTFAYDALSRKTMQCQPDNGTAVSACTAGTSYQQWIYRGNTTTFIDEGKNSWVRTTDRLGRLARVVEPGGQSTTYSYDLLDNLLCVDQWGAGSVGIACTSGRARSFTYDSLSRLLTATNPETGTVCYGTVSSGHCANGYDGNGNLIAKTDARGITISYFYDWLNRLIQKGYPLLPAASTPRYAYSCYQYDTTSGSGASATGNFVGRLTNRWTQNSTSPSTSSDCPASPPSTALSIHSVLAYDSMGRVLNERQCTKTNCTNGSLFSPSYIYDFAGNVVAYTNGVSNVPVVGSIVFGQQFDGAGRLQGLSSSWNPVAGSSGVPYPLFTADPVNGYTPSGAIQNMILGDSIFVNKTYDNRMRVIGETATHP